MADSFARQYARTQRFTIGEPRNLSVTADGRTVVMARSMAGDDPVTCLWAVEVADGTERLIVDPRTIDDDGRSDSAEDLPEAERLRRERLREGASGITAYATDASGRLVCFSLGGRLGIANLDSGIAEMLDIAGPIADPRPDPAGSQIAYVRERSLFVVAVPDHLRRDDGPAGDDHRSSTEWRVAGDDGDPVEVSWGSADFIAAEEMHRLRGHWWDPTGTMLAVTRVDVAPVQTWYLSDPGRPDHAPTPIRYPAAGTPNAETTLHLIGLDDRQVEVRWDRAALPYLCSVHWSRAGLIIAIQSRDQRTLEIRDVDIESGETSLRFSDRDDHWVELAPGAPMMSADGRLLSCADRDGTRRLLLDGEAITPDDLQVRSIIGVVTPETSESTETAETTAIIVSANRLDEPSAVGVWRIGVDGATEALTPETGVHTGIVGGSTLVIRSTTLHDPVTRTEIHPGVVATARERTTIPIEHRSESPQLTATATLYRTTERALMTAVVLPRDHDGSSALPVLLDPYGGPHAQRVLQAHHSYLISQWFADHGFAVVITDGRGTPGRGSGFERAVAGDLAAPVLEDQLDALDAIAAETGLLDLERVAIRGWSFGGYLAALAALHRPDRIHAAIAGAPVTDWRLYDTHYTERYLGDPNVDPEPYARTSLIEVADRLECPLLLIHGLADDNVVAAHSLSLSSALLAEGRPHEMLMLSGVSHMTPQEVISENLLVHQLDFLKRSLRV